MLLACSGLRTLLAAVCVTVQWWHLMGPVSAILCAPKLIFDAVLHLVKAAVDKGFMLLLDEEGNRRAGPPQQEQHQQRVD